MADDGYMCSVCLMRCPKGAEAEVMAEAMEDAVLVFEWVRFKKGIFVEISLVLVILAMWRALFRYPVILCSSYYGVLRRR